MNVRAALGDLSRLTQQIESLAQQLQGARSPAVQAGQGGQGGQQVQPFQGDTFEAGGPSRAQAAAEPAPAPQGKSYTAKGTGYYPDASPMEGGFVDRKGKPLQTLQDYLAGKAPYVS